MEENAPPAWFSEAQRGGLMVGDRVRVRLHGEYPMIRLRQGGEIAPHQSTEDGQAGTITRIIEDQTACLYRVRFDEPFPPFPSYPGTTIDHWLYTAAELERFD